MKVVKPTRVGVLHRVFENGREYYLVVSTFLFFPLSDPTRLLSDVGLWKTAAEQVPSGVLDLGMPKPVGEMLVDGSAHAVSTPRPALHVRAAVGPIDKTLIVIGDRHWSRQGPSEPEPFTEMRLSWQRSFGGDGFAKNPLGKGARATVLDGRPTHSLPNIEDPKRQIQSKEDKPDPAGFSAYDITWPERASKLGTYDAKWQKERFPGFASDLDLALFNAAPTDQRLKEGFFVGDEGFVVENMHATHVTIQGALPTLKTRVLVTQVTAGEESFRDLDVRLDTVHLFPSVDRGLLIFRSLCRIAEDDAADISHLVVGCEEARSPKPVDHYRAVLARRLDRAELPPAQLGDDELLPRSFAGEPLADDPEFERMVIREGLQADNARRGRERAERERQAERELLPPAESPSSDSASFDPKLDGALPDRAIDEAKRGAAGPPRYSADAEYESARARLSLAQRAGVEMPELEALLETPAYRERLRATQRQLEDGYRRAGHQQRPAETLSRAESEGHRERVRMARSTGTLIQDRDFTGADLSDMDLSGLDLSGAFLECANLRSSKLDRANLANAVLVRADLDGASLDQASLVDANLASSSLVEARFDGADLSRVLLEGATLVRTSLARVRLVGGTLSGARLESVDLHGAVARDFSMLKTTLVGCNLSESDWERCNFVECDFEGANFDHARLERATFVQSKLDRATFVEAHLHRLRLVRDSSAKEARFRGANLSMANLRSVDLSGADFSGANLDSADLSESALIGASFYRAIARDTRFIRADCTGATFTSANLMRAILQKATVARASFLGANLFRADFALAKGDAETSFAEANVTQVRFLEGTK